MAIDTLLLLILLAAVIILIFRQLQSRNAPNGDAEALAELRGQLAQLATQSGALQQTVASAMQESEGRLGTRLEQSLRDQNERTNRSLTGMAEKLAVIEKANEHISALSGQVTEHPVEQTGPRQLRRSAAGKSGARCASGQRLQLPAHAWKRAAR